jgi:3-oxoacyl-[acyl-carrier protein] reductase
MPKKILITGASSEIGFAIAEKFDCADFVLILQCNKNHQHLEERTRDFKAEVKLYPVNFSDDDALCHFISEINGVDVLINAAAYTKTDLLVNLTDVDIENMMKINTLAPVKICRSVIPQMLAKRDGVIINISSVLASKGNRGSSVYGGTKGFLESFSRSLASEYGMKGIRVNCVAPGAINSGSIKELIQLAPEEVKSSIALNRMGTPDDVASIVYFLCSKEAGFINGETIHVDGGFLKGI